MGSTPHTVNYTYCVQHTPGQDPQEQAMLADVYGWTEVPCPEDHQAPFIAPGIPPLELIGISLIFFSLPLLISRPITGQQSLQKNQK